MPKVEQILERFRTICT